MATVKRKQNGKVILKNGKVSCSCCGGPPGPVGCCMYPAQALGDEEYTYDDLPDVIEVLIDNVFTPFSRSGIYFYSDSAIGLIPAGDYRVRLLDTGVPWVPGTEDFQYYWRLEIWNGSSWGARDDIDDWQCLIQGLPEDLERTHDQFADTYTVTAGPYSATVSRIDICNWIGADSCGNPVSLAYASGDPYTEPFKWFASIYFGPCGDPGTAPLPGYKEGNQNTPIGEYQNGLTVS